ncbi:20381_t:CDS:2 [Gigaspora margarita]|uniref:20381_t:CDS:1 n=1 Tax=Gigaspora margarita TaxID=4874 RepID=A0ABM8W1M9_GIGMA|nr:20381_t:CDS:2 [Gigaspora margarita]
MHQYLKQAIDEGYIDSIDFNSFADVEEIKQETKSEVSKAYWKKSGQIVALKTFDLYPVGNDCSSYEEFIRKFRSTQNLNNNNVSEFYGISKDPFENKTVLNIRTKPEHEIPVPNTPQRYQSLYQQAWSFHPQERPSIEYINGELDEMLKNSKFSMKPQELFGRKFKNVFSSHSENSSTQVQLDDTYNIHQRTDSEPTNPSFSSIIPEINTRHPAGPPLPKKPSQVDINQEPVIPPNIPKKPSHADISREPIIPPIIPKKPPDIIKSNSNVDRFKYEEQQNLKFGIDPMTMQESKSTPLQLNNIHSETQYDSAPQLQNGYYQGYYIDQTFNNGLNQNPRPPPPPLPPKAPIPDHEQNFSPQPEMHKQGYYNMPQQEMHKQGYYHTPQQEMNNQYNQGYYMPQPEMHNQGYYHVPQPQMNNQGYYMPQPEMHKQDYYHTPQPEMHKQGYYHTPQPEMHKQGYYHTPQQEMNKQGYYHEQSEQQSDQINQNQQQINKKSPEQMCKETLEKYINEHQNVQNFKEPTACNSCYHVWLGDSDGLRFHLQNKEDVNGLYHFSSSESHLVLIASEHCRGEEMIKMLKVLKEFGADFNVTSKNSKTALHYLFLNHRVSTHKGSKSLKTIISFLVDNGCDINALDSSKRTLLVNYLNKKYSGEFDISIIELLLKKGANPNIPCEITFPECYFAPNALFIAIKNKWPFEVLDFLLNYGANIDQLDNDGNHLLLWTVMDRNDKKNKNKESKDEMKPNSIDWVLEHSYKASEPDILKAAEKHVPMFSRQKNIIKRWRNAPKERQRVKENCEQRGQKKNFKK